MLGGQRYKEREAEENKERDAVERPSDSSAKLGG